MWDTYTDTRRRRRGEKREAKRCSCPRTEDTYEAAIVRTQPNRSRCGAVAGLRRSNVLDSQTGRQRLLELVRLLQILDAQGVEVLAAAHLELDDLLRLLDLDGCARTPRGTARVGTAQTREGRERQLRS